MLVNIITIGDELLIGQTLDTNSHWLGQQLTELGARVTLKMAVKDDEEEILNALEYASHAADLVIITGGLGPTKDDITKHVLCKYFNTTLVQDAVTLQSLTDYFAKTNRKMPPAIETISYLPENAIILKNQVGLAPGMLWEGNDVQYLSLPGVPSEMKYLFSKEYLPHHYPKQTESTHHITLQTAGIGESALAQKIADIEDQLPKGISLAYLPDYGLVRLRLTGVGSEVMKSEMEEIAARIRERIGHYCFATGDTTIAERVGELLLEKKWMLGLAESCSGGLISHTLTSNVGASAYYKGAIVCYHNEIKKTILHVNESIFYTEGVVSEICVKEMVQGAVAALDCDVAIAVSGIAGPGGATDTKPVGLIFIAVGNKDIQIVRELRLAKDRLQNIRWASNVALNELRLFLEAEL